MDLKASLASNDEEFAVEIRPFRYDLLISNGDLRPQQAVKLPKDNIFPGTFVPNASNVRRIYPWFTHFRRNYCRGWFILSYHSSHLDECLFGKTLARGSLSWGPHPSWVDQRSVETDHATVISIRFIYESMTLSAVPVCIWSVHGRCISFIMLFTAQQREFG